MDHALTHLTGAPCEQLDIFNVNGMGGETMSLEDVWYARAQRGGCGWVLTTADVCRFLRLCKHGVQTWWFCG